jgi:hypothetical protein
MYAMLNTDMEIRMDSPIFTGEYTRKRLESQIIHKRVPPTATLFLNTWVGLRILRLG